MNNKTANYFDCVASSYAQKSNRGLWKLMRNNEAKAVIQMLKRAPKGEVLELGCGSGYYTAILKSLNYGPITCVDFSKEMLANNMCTNVKKIQKDIDFYCDEDKSYHLILCAGVLEFSKSPTHLFSNIEKMLSEGGVFVLLYPRISLFGYLYKFFHSLHQVSCTLFSPSDIHDFVHKKDLLIINEKKCLFLSNVLIFKKISCSS